MHNAQSILVEKQNLAQAVDAAELAASVTAIKKLDRDELVRVEGGGLPGVIFINRGGWTCGTFDPERGLPGSTAPRVPNY